MIRSINETKRKMAFLFILIFTAIIFLNSNLQKECMCVSLLFYGTLWKLRCRIPFNQHIIGAIWSVINQLPNLASCDNSWMCFNLCTSNTQTHIRIRLGSGCFLRWRFTVLCVIHKNSRKRYLESNLKLTSAKIQNYGWYIGVENICTVITFMISFKQQGGR